MKSILIVACLFISINNLNSTNRFDELFKEADLKFKQTSHANKTNRFDELFKEADIKFNKTINFKSQIIMELAIETLQREIKALQPYKGKKMLYGGQNRLIDEVIKQHEKALGFIQNRVDLLKAVEELKKNLPETKSKISEALKTIAEEYTSNINSDLEKTIEKFTSNEPVMKNYCEDCDGINLPCAGVVVPPDNCKLK